MRTSYNVGHLDRGTVNLTDPESVKARLAQPWDNQVVDGNVTTLACPVCAALVYSVGPRLEDNDAEGSAKSYHGAVHVSLAELFARIA